MRDVTIVDGVQVYAFKAQVQKAGGRIAVGRWVEFDELVVVNLDERLVGHIILAEIKRLFKSELLVESDGRGEIVHSNGNMRDPVEGRRRSAIRLRIRLFGNEGKNGKQSEEKCGAVSVARLPDHGESL